MTKKQKMMWAIEKVADKNRHDLFPTWTKSRWGFHTSCRKCGAFVAITVSTGQIREGELLQKKCKG